MQAKDFMTGKMCTLRSGLGQYTCCCILNHLHFIYSRFSYNLSNKQNKEKKKEHLGKELVAKFLRCEIQTQMWSGSTLRCFLLQGFSVNQWACWPLGTLITEWIKIFNTISGYISYSPVFDGKPRLSWSFPTHILYAQGWLTACWHVLFLRMLHMGEDSLEGLSSPESPYLLKACILKRPKSQRAKMVLWLSELIAEGWGLFLMEGSLSLFPLLLYSPRLDWVQAPNIPYVTFH